MLSEIIIAVVGVLSTVITGIATHLTTKKKYSAEVDGMQIQNLRESLDLYKVMLEDTQARLEQYIDRTNKAQTDLYNLRTVVFLLLNRICLNLSCTQRVMFSKEEMEHLLEGVTHFEDLDKLIRDREEQGQEPPKEDEKSDTSR